MSKPKHTPGPWHADVDLYQPVITSVGAPHEPQIALVSQIEGEAEANAHLIAAAPLMYGVLADIQDLTGHRYLDAEDLLRKIDELCRTTLFRAQGGDNE